MELSLLVSISMAMLCIGIIGILSKRNALIMFLCVELMLNAANLLFAGFSQRWENSTGFAWVFFVLVLAAAEAAVGFGITINLFRSKQLVDVDQYNDLRG
jgi:NADH-quinone oxidoreductase subunit K